MLLAAVRLCRHCQGRPATRPRRLCGNCYYDPDVREQFATQVPREVPDRYGGYLLPTEPTAAAPGSPGKLAVLIERAAAGSSLWHPLDSCTMEFIADFGGILSPRKGPDELDELLGQEWEGED